MIYGDIPFTDDHDIVNANIDFNKYDKNDNNINSFDDVNLSQYSKSNNKCVINNNNSNKNNAGKAISDVNDLIRKCLNQKQSDRLKLEDILKHRWITSEST
jgi:hypothetical protein